MVFPTGWGYKFKFTSDNTKVSSSVKGLALDLSNVTSSTFWDNVESDGSDIRITSDEAGTTLLARDVISIDTTEETGLIRLDSSSISTSADTDYYLWFGNASATEPSPSDTYGQYNAYDSSLYFLHPYNENSGSTVNDRSQNSNDGTITGASWDSDGIFDYALDFAGSSNRVSLGSKESFANEPHAYSIWFNLHSTPGSGTNNRQTLIKHEGSLWSPGVWVNNSVIRPHWNIGSTNGRYIDYNWSPTLVYNHLFFLYDGTNSILLLNGVELSGGSVQTFNSSNSSGELIVGAESGGAQSMNALMDMPTLWKGIKTKEEGITVYNNESDNASFWTINAPSPMVIFSIKGTVNLNASPVEGAKVRLINDTTNTYIGDTLTDASGNYEFSVSSDTVDHHAMVEYESGGNKYHALSKPFIKGGEE